MAGIELHLLGAHALAADGATARLKTKRSWALLAYMVINSDRAVPRDELAAILWDRSQEEQARASLRQELSSLRGALRKLDWNPLSSTKTAVTFELGSAYIDVAAFVAAAQGGADGRSRAFEHYRGPFLRDLVLPSDPFTRWQDEQRMRLAQLAVESQTALLGPEGAAPAGIDVAEVARNILSVEAANERAWRELMRHFAAQGRRAEALRQFAQCRQALERELDAAPSPATLALAQAIRDDAADAGSAASASIGTGAVADARPRPTVAQPPPPPALLGKPRRTWTTRRWVTFGAVTFGALLTGGMTVAGVQYYADGGRYTQRNLACAVPFLRPSQHGPITVGAMLPMEQEHGQRLKWGFLKFMREPPERYDFAYRIVYGDTTGGLEALPGILQDFEGNDVLAVVGPLESRKAWDVKMWGNQRRIPVVSPLASASYLTGTGGQDYFFRVSMSDSERAAALVAWLRARNLHNDPYVLNETLDRPLEPGEPEIYGASQATAAKRHLDQVQTIRFVRGDVASQLAAADRVKDDGRAVMIFGYTAAIIRMIHRMQGNGVRNPIFLMGVVQKRLEDAGFPHPETLHVVDWVQSEARDFGDARKLRQDYLDEGPPAIDYDPSAYYPYDTLEMVMDAVKRTRNRTCGSVVTGEDIAEELRRTPAKRRKVIHKGFMPATQEIHYEWDGLKIVNGRFRPVGMGG